MPCRRLRSLLRALGLCTLVLTLAACRIDLHTQLSEQDANEMLDALLSAGIDAGKEPAGDRVFNVQVAESQIPDALRVARERGLPRQRLSDLGVLFKKEGLVSTPAEERVRFQHGVAQELSATLMQIDGVVWARVHPVLPANDPLADKVKPSSASVFIKHDPNAKVDVLAPMIRNLVMRGIEGLNGDSIALTFVATDAPARVTRTEPLIPIWMVAALTTLGVLAMLTAGVTGFVVWRYRQLATTPGKSQPVPGFVVAGRKRWSWVQSLLRGHRQAAPPAPSNDPKFEPPKAVRPGSPAAGGGQP
jgi:type III secretion protein J